MKVWGILSKIKVEIFKGQDFLDTEGSEGHIMKQD